MTAGNCAAETMAWPQSIRQRKGILNSSPYSSTHTSNDLLFSLDRERSGESLNGESLNYEIVAQSVEEVQDTENAPAVSMGPYLIESGQTPLLATISIYSQRGESREQARLLYMNAVAHSANNQQPNLFRHPWIDAIMVRQPPQLAKNCLLTSQAPCKPAFGRSEAMPRLVAAWR
jgi:hypothetical protein